MNDCMNELMSERKKKKLNCPLYWAGQKVRLGFSVRCYGNLETINAGEGVEKRGHSCTAGGNVNWFSHYGEQYGGSLKN